MEAAEPGLATKLELGSTLKEMETLCKSIREMRNRTIAHRDWGRRAEKTPVTSKEEIDRALELAARIMNAVHLHFDNTTMRYDPYPGVRRWRTPCLPPPEVREDPRSN